MPHADSSLVPESIKTKTEFWNHVHTQLGYLLDGQRNWVTNLANSSSLIYNSLLAFPIYFGADNSKAVNWSGFYVDSQLFPFPRGTITPEPDAVNTKRLLLGPFCGKPACQFINIDPKSARGVCADAFLQRKTLVVPDVNSYPGHIACDGETKSEIVCPLLLPQGDGSQLPVGVLDLDCLAPAAFDEQDKLGLERISRLIVSACDW
ncbi:GAF domain nucleotide-binding protein [Collybia nuda]|uniref:GAF domain nucleotide-binding protein n=1 Tax=Collybia nuda TaxID=64659 RepID=A0A9P6CJ24_9AGAR|nr:GAF domain nucleotide-binding protein [Collybia nuda]